jgi:hypothetical protein
MSPPNPRPRAKLAGVLLRGVVVGLVVALGVQAGAVLVGPNVHTVLPGAVYRCSQPSPRGLERLIRRLGIRTVVNLRGCSDPAEWYLDECRVTCRLNVAHEDLGFSAGRLPSVPMLRQLLDVLDRSERPLLIHCYKGADRTGMASALVLLLHSDASLAEARRQLGPRTGHLPLGRTANMDRFFDLYEEWLAAKGQAHSPDVLRHWVRYEYCAGEGSAEIEVLAPAGRPLRARLGRPLEVFVRCRNTSVKPWHFQPGRNAGIHAKYGVFDEWQHSVAEEARAGLFHRTVQPGEHVDLQLVLPPLSRPGRYVLRVEMADEQHGSFLQSGCEPLFCDLEVS